MAGRLAWGLALTTSCALAWGNWSLGHDGPEWSARLPAVLRVVSLLAPAYLLLYPAARSNPALRLAHQFGGCLLLAVQAAVMWLLTGGQLVAESYLIATAALAWLLVVRHDVLRYGWGGRVWLQVALIAFVVAHCFGLDPEVRRGGHALVAAAALLAGLAASLLWPAQGS